MSDHGTTFVFSATGKPKAGTVLLVPLCSRPTPPMELVARADPLCDGAVSSLTAVQALRDDVGQLIHTASFGQHRRVLVVSLGDAESVNVRALHKAAAATVNWLRDHRVADVALWVDGLLATSLDDAVGHWAGGMALAGFRYGEFRKSPEGVPARVRVTLRATQSGQAQRLMADIRRETAIAAGVNYARLLAHHPANVINPKTLATEARKLGRDSKLKCTVIDAAGAKRLGMNGLLAVGAGAADPPCLIQLEYRGAPSSRRTTALIGKAITFDTGGYSIKPSSGLEEMKYDKCGGMTVLGALKAVAELKLSCNVVGLVATAENAVSENAYRPGDILRMASGKTVEVISTDAEGRLVLADALWYAQKKLKPTEIIDLATLTGGVRAALGTAAAGLMSNNDDLAGELGECGRRVHERLWRLPLWDDYRELIKGTDSDIKNSSGKRDAHAIVGGMFLKEFIEPKTVWAHLDIASVATSDDAGAPTGKGATGFGVRLLVEYLRRVSS